MSSFRKRLLSVCQPAASVDYKSIPLTFKMLEGTSSAVSIKLKAIGESAKTISYSLNGASYIPISTDTNIPVTAGDVISFKGDNATYSSANNKYCTFTFVNPTLAYCEIYGNINSLVDSTNFETLTTLTGEYTFAQMFRGMDYSLRSAKNLVLPATIIANKSYYQMFYGCSSMVETVKELPALDLPNKCYNYMFQDCIRLRQAPEINCVTASSGTDQMAGMFLNCASLRIAPSRISLTSGIPTRGCQNMFKNCGQLTTGPKLLVSKVEQDGCSDMYYGCSSLIEAYVPEYPVTSMGTSAFQEMFRGCTTLATVGGRGLEAQTLATDCYRSMFNGCGSLTTFPATLPATTLATRCYYYMFEGCTGMITAPELPATTYVTNAYAGIFKDCSNLNRIKCLLSTGNSDGNFTDFTTNVAASGTFIKDANASWTTGTTGIPDGWTIINNS